MLKETIDFLKTKDPEIGSAIQDEFDRENYNIELIASENLASEAILMANGSLLTNKYAEGYPGNRCYGGCKCVDVIENLAIERAKKLFNANFANVQPYSGSQANSAVYLALCKPGDTLLSMSHEDGGHITHGDKTNYSGRFYNVVSYGLTQDTNLIDYDQVEKLAKECQPKIIIAGASAYSRVVDFERFSKIAKEVGAYFMVDMAHIAGLVAAGLHPSPVPYADVVTTTTHKTLRGPRGGLILTNNAEIATKIDEAVFPGTQGGPLMHVVAAKAVAFGEALKPEFVEYEKQILKNAVRFEKALKEYGFDIVTDKTENHMLLVDLRKYNISGLKMEQRLDEVDINVNRIEIPNDPDEKENSGIRVGTPSVTTRGFKEEEMEKLAELIYLTATDFENQKDYIKKEVRNLCMRFPIYC